MIYITATFTIEPIETTLKAWCDKLGWNQLIRFSPYNQVFQLILDPNSILLTGEQDYNVIFFRFEDLQHYHLNLKDKLNLETLLSHGHELKSALNLYASETKKPTFFVFCPCSDNLDSRS